MKIDVYTRAHESPDFGKRMWEQVVRDVDQRWAWLRLVPRDILLILSDRMDDDGGGAPCYWQWQNFEGLCTEICLALEAEEARREDKGQ